MLKQLITYFTLAYLISWIIWLPLYSEAFGWGHFPVLPYHHALGGLGPMIAAIIATYAFGGKKDVLRLFKQSLSFRPVVYLLVALFSPFLLAVLAETIRFFVSGGEFSLNGMLQSSEFTEFSLPVIFAYNLVFFGFGEEVGWRGFALPRLHARFNALISAAILTLFWALWHWPLFFYRPGYTSMDVAGIVGWILSLFTGSILLSWLYNSTRASILICAIFHSTIDIAFTADWANKAIMNYMGFLITLWGITTIVIFKAKNLSRNNKQQIR